MVTLENLIKMRREFHQFAEPGWLEFQTTVKIIDYLKSYGYDVKYGKSIHSERMGVPDENLMKEYASEISLEKDYDISEVLMGYTGAVACLETDKPGPVIAMRFDIDANDVEEIKDDSHVPFKEGFVSKNKMAMHACGHDAHIATGLGVAKWLINNKSNLKGKYILIFQPAEEGVRGAKSMVQTGILNDADYFLTGHVGMSVAKGKVLVGVKGFLATSKMDVYFEGEPAHAGASPEFGKNALLAAASCALNLHTLTQFGMGMSRLNVGTLHAGTGRNVVPHKAKMQIETRGENEKINIMLKEKVDNVIKGSAIAFDLKYRVENVGGALSFDDYDQDFLDKIEKYLNEEGFKTTKDGTIGGSEDATYMMNEVQSNGGKAVYFMFGTNIKAPHHNSKFDIEEDVLMLAYSTYIKAIEMLNKE